jgi:hypothetical protein
MLRAKNKDPLKHACKKCEGIGHIMSYVAPRVVRVYCDCETGKKREKFIEEQIKTNNVEPVWELLTI